MVAAEAVVEGLFPIVQDVGARETNAPASLDEGILLAADAYWRSACATCTVVPLKVLKVEARESVRELARHTLIAAQLMAHSDLEYGPVPQGLSGRPLGSAALALEILQQQAPQRLLAQQLRSAH